MGGVPFRVVLRRFVGNVEERVRGHTLFPQDGSEGRQKLGEKGAVLRGVRRRGPGEEALLRRSVGRDDRRSSAHTRPPHWEKKMGDLKGGEPKVDAQVQIALHAGEVETELAPAPPR